MAFIMIDAEKNHEGGPGGSGRNALFLDGHCSWFILPGGATPSAGAAGGTPGRTP